MPAKPVRRRFTLFDVMALIAATALGLGLARVGWPPELAVAAPANAASISVTFNPIYPKPLRAASGYKSRMAVMPIVERVAPGFPVLASLSLAFVAIRLRSPRPRWRRLGAQPGLVAAVVAAGVWLVEAPPMAWLSWYDGRSGYSPTRIAQVAANSVVMLGFHSGLAVASAWVALALAGRWRPERSWLDRWGRAMGFAWIASAVLCSMTLAQSAWWADFLSP